MNWEQIREMQNNDLITLGSHTVYHDVISALQPDDLQHEVGGTRTVIEDALGIQLYLFAFPNGIKNDFNQDALDYLSRAGFSNAVTTIPCLINLGDDPCN